MTDADRTTANFFANFFAHFFGDTSLQEALEDGRSFKYRPQPDITAYELSLCMYQLMVQAWDNSLRSEQKVYDQLPAEAQRHFVVVREEVE